MRSKQFLRWIALTAALISGCAAARQYPAPPTLPSTPLVEAMFLRSLLPFIEGHYLIVDSARTTRARSGTTARRAAKKWTARPLRLSGGSLAAEAMCPPDGRVCF